MSNSSKPGSGQLCGQTDTGYWLSSPETPDVHVMVECEQSGMGQYVTLKKKVKSKIWDYFLNNN